jgi:hypothetical protein
MMAKSMVEVRVPLPAQAEQCLDGAIVDETDAEPKRLDLPWSAPVRRACCPVPMFVPTRARAETAALERARQHGVFSQHRLHSGEASPSDSGVLTPSASSTKFMVSVRQVPCRA